MLIDFPWHFLIGRVKMGFTQEALYRMKYGEYIDQYEAWQKLNNFEAQNMMFKDVKV